MRLHRVLASIPFLAMFSLLLVTGCEKKTENVWPDKRGPKVLTSFVPVDCFALNVVGNDGVVEPILTGQGPHGHDDPGSNHLKMANKTDVMFIIGLGVDEKLAEKIKEASGNPNFKLVELAEEIDEKCLIKTEPGHHDDGHDHGDKDPHVWLSPKLVGKLVEAIRDKMKEVDPAHAAGYDARAAAYLAKLEQLEKDGIAMLKDKKERKIIAFHDSLRYFGQCFGIEIADSIQVKPGIDPSQTHLKELIELCKKDKIRIIAVEPQFPSNTSAGTVLKALKDAGIDAEFVVIDPLETADAKELTPDLYEKTMRANLDRLAKALK